MVDQSAPDDRDWFRNRTWDADIEAGFLLRLGRARRKQQYLRIQASYLASTCPHVALALLEQYFALGDHFDIAQAHVDKARASLTLGDEPAALMSYEAALERERVDPNMRTQAYIDYVMLIIESEIVRLYPRGMEILASHGDRLIFPIDRYRANGAKAIILARSGCGQEGRDAARLAMTAAREDHSGFRYHQNIGLVGKRLSPFDAQVAKLAI